MKKLLGGLLLMALLGARPCAAQLGPGLEKPIQIGLGGGVSVPVSDVKSAFKDGYHGRGYVRLKVPGIPMAARLDFTFQRFKLDDAHVSAGTTQMFSSVASMQYGLIEIGPVRPYLLAGLGAYRVKTERDSTGATPYTSTRFGINGGAGVNVKLGGLTVFAEGHVDNVFTDSGFVDAKSIRVIPVTFGVIF